MDISKQNRSRMFQVHDSNTSNVIANTSNFEFIKTLKKKWDTLQNQNGVFRYKIDILHEKIIDEKYLMLLNPNRGTKRRVPENFDNICQPFNKEKFNFTNVSIQEILYTLTRINDDSDKHAILINNSPLNPYHCLLCPSIDKCLPQVVTQDSLKLALEVMLLIEDRTLKIAFNSLCAFASVNHLHYHLFFEHRILPVETEKWQHVKGYLYCIEDYVVPAFCFEVTENLDEITKNIFKLLLYLLQQSIPHNIFISWGVSFESSTLEAMRVFIWPRKSCSGVKKLAAFSIAACELAGWFTLYDDSEFSNMDQQGLENELKKWKYDKFSQLCDEIKCLY